MLGIKPGEGIGIRPGKGVGFGHQFGPKAQAWLEVGARAQLLVVVRNWLTSVLTTFHTWMPSAYYFSYLDSLCILLFHACRVDRNHKGV